MARSRKHDPHYEDGSEDQTMFTMPDNPSDVKKEKGKAAPTVAWAICPKHADPTGKRTGLKAAGAHLTWTTHTYQNVFGRSIPCVGSGQRLCEYMPVDGVMRRAMTAKQRASGLPERVPAQCRHGASA